MRLTWYVTDKAEYLASLKETGAAYREVLGKHFPAMALVQVVAWSRTAPSRDRGDRRDPMPPQRGAEQK